MAWLERWFRLAARPPASRASDGSSSALCGIEAALGYRFADRELLRTALTHRSAAISSGADYERLEFLGDAVLDLVIADFLMRRFPQAREGTLSKLRASIVNTTTLADKARALGIDRGLRLGKGEEHSGGRQKPSILAGAFEALIGAIYLESGFETARRVIETLFESEPESASAQRDYKTELQEAAYRYFGTHPVYELMSETGPEHAKRFTSRVLIGNREFGLGEGSSKKQSEQAAARRALELLAGQHHERSGT